MLLKRATLVLLLFLIAVPSATARPGLFVRSETDYCVVMLGDVLVLKISSWGGLSSGTRGEIVANRLQNLFEFGEADSILLDLSGQDPTVRSNLGVVVTADPVSAQAEGLPDQYELAKVWVARLSWLAATLKDGREVCYERSEGPKTETPPVIAGPTPAPREARVYTATTQNIEGTASWYGPGFHGRRTASGDVFDQEALTAAHKTLPFGTKLLVRDEMSGREVIVTVNDRGPFIGNRVLDLSYSAARTLGMVDRGVARITARVLSPAVASANTGNASR